MIRIRDRFGYPYSDIGNFQKVINITKELITGIEPSVFLSPYSIVPLISQILGLNTPLMGTGDSPYSVISLAFHLNKGNKRLLLQEAFKIPLVEKRKIIDEFYDMVAPCLLQEEDRYVELVVNTRYKEALKDRSEQEIYKAKEILEQKFSILTPFISEFTGRTGDFAHIAHYGYSEDLFRENSFLQNLSPNTSKAWLNGSYPIVNELVIRGFKAKGSNITRDLRGWIIFVANSTSELLREEGLRRRKILQAAVLADKLGAQIVSMGGLIASFARGGHYLSERIKDVGFTTGHAYTIANIMEILEKSCRKVDLDIRESTVAVVGAAGSIGSGCAKLLAEKGVKKMILIDTTVFISRSRLEELQKGLIQINSDISITISSRLVDMRAADVIIVATNSPFSLIKAEYLKPGAVVIDDSFPKNISKEILEKREDVILLEGGSVALPLSVDIDVARNMPDLMDAPMTRLFSCKEVYGCFAESLILSLAHHQGNYGLGYADIGLAKDILAKAKMFGIASAPLQCFDKAVDQKRFKNVRRLHRERSTIIQ